MKSPRSAHPRGRVAMPARVISHKLALLLASLTVAVQLTPTTAIAQTAETGSVRGRVLNAANGMYLNNARVAVDGTTIETFTNQFGEYTLNTLPAGPATIRVTYTGQTAQTATVTIVAGQETAHNVSFNADQSTTGEDGTLVLNEFTVAANRFRNAQELAINEQRTAVNIKSVISTDQFGDIPSGNVGELVKFLPGVQVDYGSVGDGTGFSDSDATTISVRGFGAEDTAILIDGMPITSSVPGSLTRTVSIDQLSINNASRVELIKVATPDMPANSVGGQINLITKSAFEQARPSYSGRAYFNINTLTFDWDKTPGPVNKETYKIQPGFEISAVYPISNKLGISVTAAAANESGQTNRANLTYAYTGSFSNAAGTPISPTNPALNRFQITDSPRMTNRRSANVRVDWKPTPSQTVKANVQYGTYESEEAQRRLDVRPVVGAGADWGPNYTIGTTANNTLDMAVTTRDRIGETKSGQLQYAFKKAGWNIEAAASTAISVGEYVDRENGHFSNIELQLQPGRVQINSRDDDGVPNSITAYWRLTSPQAGTIKDHTQLNNWAFNGTTAKSGESYNKSTNDIYKVDIGRALDFIPLGSNSLDLKVGFRRDEETIEKSGRGANYREILRPSASYVPSDILEESYVVSPGFGLPAQQWASTYKLFEIEQQRDIFYEPDFDEATNTRAENYRSWANQQKDITQTRDAWYAMLSGRFFNNRLSMTGGLRQEREKRAGRGPMSDSKWAHLRRPDGSVYTDAANPNGVMIDQGNGSVLNGVVITAPTNRPLFQNTPAGITLRNDLIAAGVPFPTIPLGSTATSLESAKLALLANQRFSQSQTGDPSYSISSSYKVTDKIDFKAAYSRSFGLPKLESSNLGLLSGNGQYTISEYTDTETQSNTGFLGQISLANPGLKPTTSDNWDFQVSYYTNSGGTLGVSYYHKAVTNQPMSYTIPSGSPVFDEVVGAIGLSPAEYDGWRLVTTSNSTTEQVTQGWEFEVRQDFGFLGKWGRRFQTFASFEIKDLADPAIPEPYSFTAPNGQQITLVPTVATIDRRAEKNGGAGLQYSGDRFTAQIRGTWREEDQTSDAPAILPNGNLLRRYYPEETRFDITLNYVLTKHLSLFLSGKDVFNAERKTIYRDDQGVIPAYAELHDMREFGVVWSFGVTGKF